MKQEPCQLTIGWKVAALTPNMASVRYRAMLPLLGLEAEHHQCRVFANTRTSSLDGLDALIIVKSFTAGDLLLADQAHQRGIPVIIDLCDNIFIETYGESIYSKQVPADIFRAIAAHATAIVVTTEPLAQIVKSQVPGTVCIHVIPDGIETQETIEQTTRYLARARSQEHLHQLKTIYRRIRNKAHKLRPSAWIPLAKRIKKRLRNEMQPHRWKERGCRYFDWLRSAVTGQPRRIPVKHPQASSPSKATQRILWFGNHGAQYARFGILDLLEIRAPLEQIAKEFDVELVVVSNHAEKFRQHIQPMRIPSRYVEWSPHTLKKQLAQADVVVIPNTLDPFSICKSANRTVLALTAGVPVVATATPSLEPLTECIITDDFLYGLRTYLTDSSRVKQDVAHGKWLTKQLFGQHVITSHWLQVLTAATAKPLACRQTTPELIVVLNLIQDLDLALPILQAALKRGIRAEAYCSSKLLHNSPRVFATLQAHAIPFRPVSSDVPAANSLAFPASVRALLTISETNLGPHHFSRQLTEQAIQAGIHTATLQHGFENVGLTYHDKIHDITRINFAADTIYLWGPLTTLHPLIPAATREKCIPAGCPKPAYTQKAELGELLPPGKPVVGVFENLHWHRYSEAYLEFFINGVRNLALAFPDIVFLIKPHHAGMWLTQRYKGNKPVASNIIFADPANRDWEAHTAASLMGHLSAVITSPSTVALDAARMGLPTSVVAFDLQLPNYAPLNQIIRDEDWHTFINALNSVESKQQLTDAASLYVEQTILPGHAATHILDHLITSKSVHSGSTP